MKKQHIKKKQTTKNKTKENKILGNTALIKKQLVWSIYRAYWKNYYIGKKQDIDENQQIGKNIGKNKTLGR